MNTKSIKHYMYRIDRLFRRNKRTPCRWLFHIPILVFLSMFPSDSHGENMATDNYISIVNRITFASSTFSGQKRCLEFAIPPSLSGIFLLRTSFCFFYSISFFSSRPKIERCTSNHCTIPEHKRGRISREKENE